MIARLAGVAALALCLSAQAAEPLRKVQFNMSWLPQGSMAGIVVAQERGLFQAQGLEVSLLRGFGGIRTANELDQGLFDFGYVDPMAVILNRANGGHVRMVAPINGSLPAGLCSLSKKHVITDPKHLAGLTVGGGQNSPMQALIPIWLKQNGLDRSQITLLGLDPSVMVSSLIAGKIDAAECWIGNSLPLFRQQAAREGQEITMIRYGDFGFDIPGAGIAASDKMIAQEPELVHHFVAAAMEGYRYAGSHVDEAAALMAKRFPILDPEITREQIRETEQLRSESFAPEKMQRAVTLMREAAPGAAAVKADDIYSAQR
jgi:NitT/TauT family transport system substrate-binding protein